MTDCCEQLREALTYVRHKEKPLCPKAWHAKDGRTDEFACTCGLDAVLRHGEPSAQTEEGLAKLALFDRMREALRIVENSGWSQAWLTELLAEADALAEEKE